jgi:hypothetical protein
MFFRLFGLFRLFRILSSTRHSANHGYVWSYHSVLPGAVQSVYDEARRLQNEPLILIIDRR